MKETRLIYRVSGFSIANANREAKAEVVSGSSKNEAPVSRAKECSENGKSLLYSLCALSQIMQTKSCAKISLRSPSVILHSGSQILQKLSNRQSKKLYYLSSKQVGCRKQGSCFVGRGCLQSFMTFLSSLNNPDTDGRIIIDLKAGTCKFILLNAAAQFSKVSLLQ